MVRKVFDPTKKFTVDFFFIIILSKFLVDIYVYVPRVVLFSIIVRETPFNTG